MGLKELISENWFTLLQSLGIIGSLALASLSFRDSFKARQVSTLLEITQNHREIWQHISFHPELGRITDASVDIDAQPITQNERIIVHLLILHLNSTFEAISNSSIKPLQGMDEDIRQFFAAPIPRRVWDECRNLQNSEFRSYLDSRLG